MAFVPYIQSNTGILRALIPNVGIPFRAPGAVLTPPYDAPLADPYLNDATINAGDIPSGSCPIVLNANEWANMPASGRTIFGFYLYDENDRYINKILRLQLYRGQYNGYYRQEIYDPVHETILSAVEAGSSVNINSGFGVRMIMHFSTYDGRPCIQYAGGSYDSWFNYWRFESAGCLVLQSGSGSIVGGGEKTKVRLIRDPNDRDPEDDDREGGGGGEHNPRYDTVPIPQLPTLSPLSGGAFNAFSLDETEMRQFNADLYDPDAWQALKNYFADPMEFLMGCILVPVSPPTLGTLYPYFPFASHPFTWPHAYRRITDEFVEVNCGSIFIPEYYGSCFDYSPYTKIDLWLPFVGFVHLDPDEVMNETIEIKYHVDAMTGACTALVSIGVVGQLGPQIARVLGEFNGNCGMQVPVSKANFDNALASAFQLCGAVATAAGIAISGGASVAAMEQAGASEAAIASREIGLTAQVSSRLGSATMSAVAGSKAGVTKSGGMGGSVGVMGVLTPYVVIHTPRQCKPSNYIDMKGYPSNIGGKIGDFSGYLEVSDVRLNNIPATVKEIEEIYNLLKGGILL